jgi:hypothetical protein
LITELKAPFRDYSELVHTWSKDEKRPRENGVLYTYDIDSNRRIKTLDLIKIFIKLNFKTVASKNHFDKTIYIKFEDVKKVLLKDLFKAAKR